MERTAHIFQKGRGVICIYQDYSHKKDGQCNGKKRWRCTVRGCKGKVHTVNDQDDGTATVVFFNPHDHIANPVSLANNQIKARLLDFVNQKDNLHLSVEKVYYKYISHTKFEDEPPSYNNCKTIMHRARQSFLKSMSEDVSNINATSDNHRTISERDLLMEGENSLACQNIDNEETVYLTEEASSSILKDILVDCHVASSATLPNKNIVVSMGTKRAVSETQKVIETNKFFKSLNKEIQESDCSDNEDFNTSWCNIQSNDQTKDIHTDNINDNTSITIKDLKTILDRFSNNSPEKQQNIENKNVNFNKSMLDNSRNVINKRVLNGGTENTQAKKPKTKTTQRLPDIPPPPTFSLSLPPEERDHLYSMLTSWYMSGYHSGYYKCFKEHFSQKKKFNII